MWSVLMPGLCGMGLFKFNFFFFLKRFECKVICYDRSGSRVVEECVRGKKKGVFPSLEPVLQRWRKITEADLHLLSELLRMTMAAGMLSLRIKGPRKRGEGEKKTKSRLCKDARTLPLSTPSDENKPLPPAVDGECMVEIEKAEANESGKTKVNESEGVHADIDGGNREDPQMCSSYVHDIYNHLRIAELKKKPKSNFMVTLQKDITPNMRGILIDWLVEVSEEYKLVPDTLYLTVGYIDCFLSVYPVSRHKLQPIRVTCMFIASKYEEICPPHIEELYYR